jgi:hypothetical protein
MFLLMMDPGVEVWYCKYANAKDDTTNRTIFLLLYAAAGLKAQF